MRFILSFEMFVSLFLAEWFCDTLWRKAGLGGPGEESVLLDSPGSGYRHPHLLCVEKTDLANTGT